jgi:hypothetical protein
MVWQTKTLNDKSNTAAIDRTTPTRVKDLVEHCQFKNEKCFNLKFNLKKACLLLT